MILPCASSRELIELSFKKLPLCPLVGADMEFLARLQEGRHAQM